MSRKPAIAPGCPHALDINAIETLIIPRARDLGGIEVRRALPATCRQMVGLFIFFDQVGPAELLTGQDIDRIREHGGKAIGTDFQPNPSKLMAWYGEGGACVCVLRCR
jgi:hypothetical protein